MAIILFPPRNNAGLVESVPQRHHFHEWSNKRFPNPLIRKGLLMNGEDKSYIKKIAKLYYRLLVFIKNYFTKAIAACPLREYLCLPHLLGRLTFKDCPVCTELCSPSAATLICQKILLPFIQIRCPAKSVGISHPP